MTAFEVPVPLCVDLDGTLTCTDTLHELILALAKHDPLALFQIPAWLRHGKAAFAHRISERVRLDPSEIPYRPEVLELIAHARAEGTVPLSHQALRLIASIEREADYSSFVFPSRRLAERPMSENTINAALRRLGYSEDEMTGHCLRAMAATLLNEIGIWHAGAIKRQLAHCDGNAVRRA